MGAGQERTRELHGRERERERKVNICKELRTTGGRGGGGGIWENKQILIEMRQLGRKQGHVGTVGILSNAIA